MDIDAFRHTLSGMFDDFPRSVLSAAPLLLSDVSGLPGLAEPNNLALLRAAAMALGPDEAYLEAGSHSGLSAVTVGNSCSSNLWILDDFSIVSRGPLDAALAEHGLLERGEVVVGDALESISGLVLPPVGLFYYDAAHDIRHTLLSLRAVRPLLAREALVILDDLDFPSVELAASVFVRENPSAELIMAIDGKQKDAQGWWFGTAVIAWRSDRPGGTDGLSAGSR